jgi:hypothetical protein
MNDPQPNPSRWNVAWLSNLAMSDTFRTTSRFGTFWGHSQLTSHTIHPFFSTVVPASSAVSVILKVDKDDAGAILLSVSVLGPLLAVVSIVPNHSFRKNNGIIFWLGWIGKTLK